MNVPLVHLVASARPNLPKLSVLWAALAARPGLCEARLVHTGQHFDEAMFGGHLAALGLPRPHHALGVSGGGHAAFTAACLLACAGLWQRERPAVVVVVGDVDGTLAAALAARQLRIPVVHLEAGLRCEDRDMAEEINRRAVDAIADLLWAPSHHAAEVLRGEGHAATRVVVVGNTMAASLLAALPRALAQPLPAGLAAREYGVLTLHRAENVDDAARLAEWLAAVAQAARLLPLAWPRHPRTAQRMAAFGLAVPAGVMLLPPLGYLEFLGLLARARLVASDSGGIQEEATMLDLPCLTLRETTERPETLVGGASRLVAPAALPGCVAEVLAGAWPHAVRPALWDEAVGARMAESLAAFLAGR